VRHWCKYIHDERLSLLHRLPRLTAAAQEAALYPLAAAVRFAAAAAAAAAAEATGDGGYLSPTLTSPSLLERSPLPSSSSPLSSLATSSAAAAATDTARAMAPLLLSLHPPLVFEVRASTTHHNAACSHRLVLGLVCERATVQLSRSTGSTEREGARFGLVAWH